MSFRLLFKVAAKREWNDLDTATRFLFAAKLKKCLEHPCVESLRLNGIRDSYKIKLSRIGYCLVYQVRGTDLIVSSVTVGKKERNHAYKAAIRKV